ncbi:MAG: hypothetical protein M1518_01605 [Candidatus Thermoplasmatota archaeon]|jgi:photosystem II stability/assembly factor-like uncharacterized protein|nr:hypothetical protein [Candidatus Thermoplasmatota archaeon]
MKKDSVVVSISTENGAYFVKSDTSRKKWSRSKCFLSGESVNNVAIDGDGRFYASTLTEGVFSSSDRGETWKPSNKGLHVRKVWTVEVDKHQEGLLYAGTQYGHLFRSTNSGKLWEEVTGLYTAPHRENWGIDWGFGTTGLTIHSIKTDPYEKGKLYIVAAGNGTYRSDDAGNTWKSLKGGITESCPILGGEPHPSIPSVEDKEKISEHLNSVHSCTHKIALSSSKPGTIYQQNHCGVYASTDSGNKWKDISKSKEDRHGFPIMVLDGKKESVFVIPAYQGKCKKHNSCIEGQITVNRTEDGGKKWKKLSNGLPKGMHTVVLRDGMAQDSLEEPGVYFGTSTGELFGSIDLGESWNKLASGLGRIQGVSAFNI